MTDDMMGRVRRLRDTVGHWPQAKHAARHDPALLGAANDAGLTFAELVKDTRRADGEPVPEPPEEPGRWAMVLGGAACVWDDVDALEAMLGRPWPGRVVAVNDIMAHWPRHLDHVATLHPEKLRAWEALRRENGHPDGYARWARRCRRKVDRILQPWGGGSSGLYAVAVAYEIGASKVVLCGMPMTDDPHFEESTEHDGSKWTAHEGHRKAWRRKRERIQERTRSMSGWTRYEELPDGEPGLGLGAPTLAWLYDEETDTREAA